jgi:hypothetical protein
MPSPGNTPFLLYCTASLAVTRPDSLNPLRPTDSGVGPSCTFAWNCLGASAVSRAANTSMGHGYMYRQPDRGLCMNSHHNLYTLTYNWRALSLPEFQSSSPPFSLSSEHCSTVMISLIPWCLTPLLPLLVF